ncbi:hypothetical protein J3F83DRAFT_724178 [Trichoderma novae-zelandiae]
MYGALNHVACFMMSGSTRLGGLLAVWPCLLRVVLLVKWEQQQQQQQHRGKSCRRKSVPSDGHRPAARRQESKHSLGWSSYGRLAGN